MKLDTKNKYFIVGFTLMCILCYKMGLEKTYILANRYYDNIVLQESKITLPEQMTELNAREKLLNQRLKNLNLGELSDQNRLLKILSKNVEKNQLKIIEFGSPHLVTEEKETVETFILKLEGGYHGILKTLYALETHKGLGIISHVAFQKKRNYRTKRYYLQANVHLEQIR